MPVEPASGGVTVEREVLAESTSYAAVDAVQQGIAIVVTPVLLFLLTFEEFGVVTWATVLSQVVMSLATGGLDLSVVRFYHRWPEADRPVLVAGLAAVGVTWSAGLLVLAHFLVPSSDLRWPLVIGCWAGVVLGVRSILLAVFRMTRAFSDYAVTMVGGSLTQATLQIVLVLYGWGAVGFMAGYLGGVMASAVFAAARGRTSLGWRSPSWRLTPEVRWYVFSVWPSVFLNRLLLVADRVVLGRLGGLETLGVYGVASRLTAPLKLLSGGFKLALAPALSRAEAEGLSHEALLRRLGQFIVVTMLFVGSLIATTVWFVHLTPWAERSQDLQRVVALLLLAQFLSGMALLGQVGLYYSPVPRDASVVVGVTGVALVAGLLVLVPRANGLGAAAAQVLSGAGGLAAVLVFAALRRGRLDPWPRLMGLLLPFLGAVAAVWAYGLTGQLVALLATLSSYGVILGLVFRKLRAVHHFTLAP